MAKVPSKRGRADLPPKSQMQKDWHNLCSEFNLCKRKLQAKTEGLLVLAKELDNVRQEKDAYKLMAEQLREKYHGQKKKYEEREKALGLSLDENDPLSERRSQSLAQILCETREQNRKAELEIKELRQKLTESEGDMKILRENIARQRVGDEGVGMRHFPAHEREMLVAQLEAAREQVENLERDMVAKIDELQEHVTERDFFRQKADHLNEELNYVLGGNERRIVDIDAMLMENKYLKERLKQVQEEKSHAQAVASKYKGVLERRKGKGIVKSNSGGGSLVLSQKQVENLLGDNKVGSLPVTSATITDLHSLSRALLETIHDKNVAINHQRNTNKILGKRVEELENKLKTLEVAGLWNMPPARTAAMKAWQTRMSPPDDKETLIPRQVSLETNSSDQSGSSIPNTPQHISRGTSLETAPKDGEEVDQVKKETDSERTGERVEVEMEDGEENRDCSGGIANEVADNKVAISDESISARECGDFSVLDESGIGLPDCDEELPGVGEEVVERGVEEERGVAEIAGKGADENGELDIPSSEKGDTGTPNSNVGHEQTDENIDILETLFDTVAEKLAKEKSMSRDSGQTVEAGTASTKTPLLLPSSSEGGVATQGEEESTVEKGSKMVVDTAPQCV